MHNNNTVDSDSSSTNDNPSLAIFNPAAVAAAHARIAPHVVRTPVRTCPALDELASTAAGTAALWELQAREEAREAAREGAGVGADTNTSTGTTSAPGQGREQQEQQEEKTATIPRVRFFFKCENEQRVGAFKARGAFHALGRLVEREGHEVVRARGVVTCSSGE